ncbi:RpiR family transcriptional regulator [Listeria weihenstephanensis]|uniref:RpiR family transcriptional regulator n=1 Tax=Listeria weihenstephanensis TaxID=1006155 RepID=A0A841Z449_9LIST|nr:RpiR family transcriptional regulator [Listeria weihenstephanensis]MBC1499076.1 RpiR family transcriptional regulator [Listeria weihenstephanensis]
MRVEGMCKVTANFGMEFQYGEFYLERDYLVFDRNYSFGMKKRQTFPIAKLQNIKVVPENGRLYVTFACGPTVFELDSALDGDLKGFAQELRTARHGAKTGKREAQHFKYENRRQYTTHHQHHFAE